MIQTNETLLSLVGSNFKRFGPDEYHGPCWKCGGNHRFIVFGNGTAWCRQCNWRGDSIQLLRDRDGLSYIDAAAKVGRDVQQPQQKKQQKHNRRVEPALRASTPKEVQFDQTAWSSMAHKLTFRAMEKLVTSDEGKQAEEYLRARGLTLMALCGTFVGYIPRRFESTWGGLNVVVERGISIPWFDGSQIVHKVNVRTDNLDTDKRYKAVTGSTNGAYLSYRVRPRSIVVLVEGEIDALSVISATEWKVNGVATGSTMGGRLLSVVARLAMARRVLVAFDSDEPGENAAQWWLQVLPNARRHLPTRHDVNEMLQIDGPEAVQQWIADGFKDMRRARPLQPAPVPTALTPLSPAQAITLPGMGFSNAYHEGGL